jgi:chloride channel 3/4/5
MSVEWAQCADWTPWRDALRISNAAGGYIVEYIFFILFSVSSPTLIKGTC